MKKLLLVILAMFLIASSLIGCSSDDSNESNESKTQSSATSETQKDESKDAEESQEPIDPYAHLRSFNFNNEEVVFLVHDDTRGTYKSVEILEHEANSDAINQAIADRNEIVQNLLGVQIKEIRSPDILSDARNDISGGGEYDIIMPYMPDAGTLASEGSLMDFYSFDNIIKLENSYWDQRANKDLSFGNRLFFTVGDACLLNFDCTHAIVFNKTLMTKCGAENPYELLRNNKWTYDALWRNAKLATADTDGIDGMSSEDTWGFLINENYTTTLYIGSGERLTNKDDNDIPVMSDFGDNAATIVQKIREMYNDQTSTLRIETMRPGTTDSNSVWAAASRAVGEGRALFRSLAIVDLGDLDDYDCSYGIMPTPKASEEQDEYYNIVSIVLAACPCITKSVQNPELSAAVIEAMQIASTDTVKRAYYDTILKGRRIPDEEGEYALDVIFNNRVYEIATVYKFNTLNTLISTCASSAADIFASQIETIRPSVEQAISKLAEDYKNFID